MSSMYVVSIAISLGLFGYFLSTSEYNYQANRQNNSVS